MNSRLLNLRYVMNIEKWEAIQDFLALVTGMAIITVDYKGIPVTKHSNCCDFCQIMRNNPDTAKHCQKCDSRAGLEAVRINKPYIYLCHCNIVDVAIPIIIEDKYVGAVMAGQVILPENENSIGLEKILEDSKCDTLMKNDSKLKENYKKLFKLAYEKINVAANLIWHFSNYIVEEAITRNVLYELNQKIQHELTGTTNLSEVTGYPVDLMKDIKDQIAKQQELYSTGQKSKDSKAKSSTILKPAIEYIDKNIKEDITLGKVADICHVSSSYFSRLFLKEMGENFTSFLSKAKIAHAKVLLETTDIPITELAYSLGFNDCGYFIKQFKKYEEVTPTVYRKYLK